MSRGSSCLVFFQGNISLDDAARALGRSLAVTRDGDALVVRWKRGRGPELVIGLSLEPHVIIEAQELAEFKAQPGLEKCDRRFEVMIDDLEAALDETNTLAEVQMTLGDLTKGYVFNSWNGLFQPREP